MFVKVLRYHLKTGFTSGLKIRRQVFRWSSTEVSITDT